MLCKGQSAIQMLIVIRDNYYIALVLNLKNLLQLIRELKIPFQLILEDMYHDISVDIATHTSE